jgi:hypothetical protein
MNQRTGDWNSRPNHDWSSHAVDAFRYGCIGMRDGDEDENLRDIARTGRLSDGRNLVDMGEMGFA